MVDSDNELKGGNCSPALEEVALRAVRGALSLLPHTARRGPARRPKREETIIETRDIFFVLKLDNDELEACMRWCSCRRGNCSSTPWAVKGVLWVFSPLPHAPGLLEFGDAHIAIVCARDFFSADSSEFDEGA